MSDDADFSALSRRFQTLHAADRRAVLSCFSASDRASFEHALAEERRKDQAEEERRLRTDAQFQAYSPWLAELIEESLSDRDTPSGLTPAAAEALAAHHQTLLESIAHAAPLGIAALARRAWMSLLGETRERSK